jgi:DHA1 family tetracycline resistance protein-like MFS transporter
MNAQPALVPASAPGRAAFAFIFVTICLDMLALGVMAPVLPKLVVQFEGGDIARAASITGLFGFVWAAAQFLFAPVTGALSDRYGRRPIVLLSNLGLGLDYVLMAVAPSLSWLFAGRVVSGITAASFAVAAAYIADVTPPEKRAAQFGMLGAAFGLGFIIGPAVGGVLGGISLRLPFWVAAGLSLTNAAYGLFVLPESLPRERRARVGWHLANPLGSLTLLGATPGLLGLALVSFLYYLAHESLPSIFVLYTNYRYGWSERSIGLALAGVGLCSTLVSALLVKPTVQRLGERRTLALGLICGVVGFLLYGLGATGAVFFTGIPFVAMWGLTGPACQALMSRRLDASTQGRLQGALASLRGVTGMIGPLLFTQIFATAIGSQRTVRLPGAAYTLAALLLGASLAMAWQATRAEAAKETA